MEESIFQVDRCEPVVLFYGAGERAMSQHSEIVFPQMFVQHMKVQDRVERVILFGDQEITIIKTLIHQTGGHHLNRSLV